MEVVLKMFPMVLIIMMAFSSAESYNFTKQPPKVVTARLGGKITFHWMIEIGERDRVMDAWCRFNNNTNERYTIASGKNLKPNEAFPKVKTSNKAFTVEISNIGYHETGIYQLEVLLLQGGVDSKKTFLTVEGKPEFCVGIPNNFRTEERIYRFMKIIACASQTPTIYWKMNEKDFVDTKMSKLLRFYNYYSALVTPGSLPRKKCGRNLTLYANNSFGISAKRSVRIDVLFIPIKPKILKALYLNSEEIVQVVWLKQESGLCPMNYRVDFLNSKRYIVTSNFGQNVVNSSAHNTKLNNISAVIVTAYNSVGNASSFYQLAPTDTFKFIQQPEKNITVVRGKNIWLHWKHDGDGRERVLAVRCFFTNKSSGNKVIIAKGAKLKPKRAFPRIKTYLGNTSIQIVDIDFTDTGIYEMEIDILGVNAPIKSHQSVVTVEQRPEFRRRLSNEVVTKREGESETIKFNLCGVPKPKFIYKWDDGLENNTVLFPINESFFCFTAKVLLGPLQRDRCGRSIVYYSQNRLGNSTKYSIKFNVLFQPARPTDVTVQFLRNRTKLDVKWKAESRGLCNISYQVDFMDASEHALFKKVVKNTPRLQVSNPNVSNVAAVTIMASNSQGSAIAFHKFPTKAQRKGKKKNLNLVVIVGSASGSLIIMLAVSVIVYLHRKRS